MHPYEGIQSKVFYGKEEADTGPALVGCAIGMGWAVNALSHFREEKDRNTEISDFYTSHILFQR